MCFLKLTFIGWTRQRNRADLAVHCIA